MQIGADPGFEASGGKRLWHGLTLLATIMRQIAVHHNFPWRPIFRSEATSCAGTLNVVTSGYPVQYLGQPRAGRNRLGLSCRPSGEFILRLRRSLPMQVVRCDPVFVRHEPSSSIVLAFGGGAAYLWPSADVSTVFSARFQAPSFDLLKHQGDLPG